MTPPAAAIAALHSVSRILVVDDDETIRLLTTRLLESQGFEVFTADAGTVALEIARVAMMHSGTAIHLVLTDVEMPGMGGYELGRKLALTWPALPVVYMSGGTHGLLRRVTLGPWDHFIRKPFSAPDLLATLSLVLGQAARPADPSRPGRRPVPAGGETAADAMSAARGAVAYLDEEARWALLQQWLEAEAADQRVGGRRSLRLDALRSIVSPYVSDGVWDEIVREHWPVRWADQLRLANALACVRIGETRAETATAGELRASVG
jgi:CheY-like chemotaxis protein